MLTGDKGTTAKMIGVQCGMLSPLATEIVQQTQGKALDSQSNSAKAELKTGTDNGTHPVNLISIEKEIGEDEDEDDGFDLEAKIDELVQRCNAEFDGKKELLIDGSVFNDMVRTDIDTQKRINEALK